MSHPEAASRWAMPAPIPTVQPTPVIRARGRVVEGECSVRVLTKRIVHERRRTDHRFS
jgi:hypothetical protein